MCESAAYVKKGEKEELVMESVAKVLPLEGGKFMLRGILGDSLEVSGTITEINYMSNRIVFSGTE